MEDGLGGGDFAGRGSAGGGHLKSCTCPTPESLQRWNPLNVFAPRARIPVQTTQRGKHQFQTICTVRHLKYLQDPTTTLSHHHYQTGSDRLSNLMQPCKSSIQPTASNIPKRSASPSSKRLSERNVK